MEKPVLYARQRIITAFGVETLNLPPHPAYWVHPRQGVTGVELVGIEPTPEFIALAEAYGWHYCQVDGRFYPL
jgi:hypothetical protein